MIEYNIKVSPKVGQEKETIIKKQTIVLNQLINNIKKLNGMTDDIYKLIIKRIKRVKFKIEEQNYFNQKYFEVKKKETSLIPTGFYSIKDDTVYLRGDAYIRPGLIATEVSKQTERIIIQETLYALACNNKDKLGWMTVYAKEGEVSKVVGQGLNKVVTVDISHKIIGENRVNGIPLDYELILDMIKEILDLTEEEYINIYFKEENWYGEEIEKRFNKKKYKEMNLMYIIEQYDVRRTLTEFNPLKIIAILDDIIENMKENNKKEKIKKLLIRYKAYFDII